LILLQAALFTGKKVFIALFPLAATLSEQEMTAI
jgi:hypothetical protein